MRILFCASVLALPVATSIKALVLFVILGIAGRLAVWIALAYVLWQSGLDSGDLTPGAATALVLPLALGGLSLSSRYSS